MSKKIPLSDPRIADILIQECHESMVSIENIHKKIYADTSTENANCLGYQANFIARRSVAERLKTVADALPEHLSILIKESYRPYHLQKTLFDGYVNDLLIEKPNLSIKEVEKIASHFIAPPIVAGHPTGGAVDVTLIDKKGNELDMGCAYDEDEKSSNGACHSYFDELNSTQQLNRKQLFDAMTQAGFINYPFEWWHWSFGDRYWAFMSEKSSAIFGPIHI